MKKLILGIIFFTYCSFAGAASSIIGQTWIFDTINGSSVDISKYQAQKPNIVFDVSGRFVAYAGCNRIAGSYTLSGQDLTFSPNTIMTKMACPGNENLENDFVAILPQVRHWAIDHTVLTLSSSNGAALITLKSDGSE